MKIKSLVLLGTLTFMTLVGSAISAQAESRIRVVRGQDSYRSYAPSYRTESCPPPVARYHRDHGRHRGWYHRQPVVYVPVVTRPVAYREVSVRPHRTEGSSFYLHVSEDGTSFGIALGR